VALKLIGMGYPKVYALKGGWKAWSEGRYPVEQK
jgi:3-mercaptopyruvate sulfurtransferase SseA